MRGKKHVSSGLAVLLVFAAAGVIYLTGSRADTFFVAEEAENGTLQGVASLQTAQTDASGGQSVKFGSSDSLPGADSLYGFAVGGNLPYQSTAEQASRLDTIKELGGKWVRFDLSWSAIQAGGQSSFDWTRFDATITAIQSRGLQPLPILLSVPQWSRPSSCNTSDVCVPADFSDFANFAGQATARYAPQGIHHWEVWNEPNNVVFWKPKPDASAYTHMLQAAYSAIKSLDPSAVVLGGSTSPATTDGTNIAPRDFMQTMYAQGAKGYFDAFAHHPYCYAADFDCPDTVADWSAWSQMNETSPSLRSIMAANGDSDKKIWLTEFGAPTGGGTKAVSEALQAKMVADAYAKVRTTSWLGPLLWYSLKDNGTNSTDMEDWFGVLRTDGSHKPAYDAYKTESAK